MKVLHALCVLGYLRQQNLYVVPVGTRIWVQLSGFEVSVSFACGSEQKKFKYICVNCFLVISAV